MPRTVNFGGGLAEAQPQYISPAVISRQRAMADAILQGTNRPVTGIGEGISQLANTAAGLYAGHKADEREKASTSARAQALQAALASDDPIASLAQSNDPELQNMSLQYHMAQAMKDPGETFQPLTDEEERAMGLDPAGTYQRSSTGKIDVLSKAPEAFKPNVQEFFENGQRVKGYLDAQGNLVKVGDSAPMFAPQQAPQEPDRVRRAKAAGLVEGSPEFNEFVLSSDQAAANPKQENILRDEFNALTKDFRTVQDAYSKIESTSATGAGDMSMLYSYVKLLDPGSVVRESEFAVAAASGSFGEQVQGAVARLATGERLPDSLRNAFKTEAKAIFSAQKAGYERLKTSYGNLATRTGVPTENVIVDYAAPEAAPPVDLGTQTPATAPAGQAPSAGDITEGTVIVNPQTKERLVLKGGQWVPAP